MKTIVLMLLLVTLQLTYGQISYIWAYNVVTHAGGVPKIFQNQFRVFTNQSDALQAAANPGNDNSIQNILDVCSTSFKRCSSDALCTDINGTLGVYQCECLGGYEDTSTLNESSIIGFGTDCQDIDECAMENACGTGSTNCTNLPGTFNCACGIGFEVDSGTCVDIDECLSFCLDDGSECTNTIGSYVCSCQFGFFGDGLICSDVDECDDDPCHVSETCTNNVGSFICTSDYDYSGNEAPDQESANDYCYRLSITFDEAVFGDTTSRLANATTAVKGFLNELVNATIGFRYDNYNFTLEKVKGSNTSGTEFIIELCLNGVSATPKEFTDILQDFNFTTTINDFPVTILEFNECSVSYGNCSTKSVCTNTDGDYLCKCQQIYADKSAIGQSGIICEPPTLHTCSSNSIEVIAFNPYFESLGINYTDLYLGSCNGTLKGSDILYRGNCDPVIEENATHLFYRWNLTNVEKSPIITVGNYVTIPITCTFLNSQNVSFNVSAERNDINFNESGVAGESYDFTVSAFLDEQTKVALPATVNTNTKVYFMLGTSGSLPNNLRIQCQSFRTSSVDLSFSTSLELIRNGCPVAPTSTNRRVLDTLSIVRNGVFGTALIGVNSHFYGQSRLTLATFEVNVCLETGGNSCGPVCNSRRRRSIIDLKMKRETVQTGEVQLVLERATGDECSRDCGFGGICVFDQTSDQQCVCADGYVLDETGICKGENPEPPNNPDIVDDVVMIVLIVLVVFLIVLVGFLIILIVLKKRKKSNRIELSGYTNTISNDS